MNNLLDLLPQYLINSLGWTILNSLWQSIVVMAVLFIFTKLFKPSSSNSRYLMFVLSLVAIVIWSFYTFVSQYSISTSTVAFEALETIGGVSFTSFGVETISKITSNNYVYINENYFPIVVGVWILGVLFISIKTVGGLWYIQYLKTHHAGIPNEQIIQKLTELKTRLNILKNVRIFESYRTNVPMVIGHLKPVILIPIGICTGLTIDEVEAILAHELSHIKRHDYFINMFQSLIESLFFYNPIVWWLSAQIKKERELSCDDVALHIGINKLTFAEALASIQQLKLNTTMAMTLGKNKKHLLQRIKRAIEGEKNYKSNSWDKALSIAVIIGALVSLSWYSVLPSDKNEHMNSNSGNSLIIPVTSNDTTIIENIDEIDQSQSISIDVDPDSIMKVDKLVDVTNIVETINISEVIDATVVDIDFDGINSVFDLDYSSIVPTIRLDTIPEIDDLVKLELTELMENQLKVMEDMKLQLSNLHELDWINEDLSEEQLRKMEEAVRNTELQVQKLAKIHEKDFSLDKLEMDELHKRMGELHKREFEIQKKLEQSNIHEVQGKMEEMEKVMRQKELEMKEIMSATKSEMQELEKRMQAFEDELIKELVEDGYLKKGEKLNELRFNDDNIEVNGEKVNEKDAKKYRALKKIYFNK